MRTYKNITEMNDRELRNYKRKLRLQRERRRKCMMALLTFCLISFGAVSYHSIESSAKTDREDISFKYYTNITVAYGDSLWKIADEYIDYDKYDDKEDYIAEVRSINHLGEDSAIRAGQNLVVPYYSNEFVK